MDRRGHVVRNARSAREPPDSQTYSDLDADSNCSIDDQDDETQKIDDNVDEHNRQDRKFARINTALAELSVSFNGIKLK